MNHFQVLNGTENVIINNIFQNMCVLRKESISDFETALKAVIQIGAKVFVINAEEKSGYIASRALLRYPVGENELLAFCGSGDLVVNCVRKGNEYVFSFYPNGTTMTNSPTMTADEYKEKLRKIEFIVYGYDNAPSGNYGLQVFSESGELLFDANKKYMHVLDYMYGSAKTMTEKVALEGTRTYDVPVEIMPLTTYSYKTQGDGSGYWTGDGSEYDDANWYYFRYLFQFNADNEIVGKIDKLDTILLLVEKVTQYENYLILEHYV